MAIPRSFAAGGVIPTWATSGSVYVQWGMTRSDNRRPTLSRALATASLAVAIAAWVYCSGWATSPAAYTVVRCPQVVVGLDPGGAEPHPGRLQAHPVHVGLSAGRDQEHVVCQVRPVAQGQLSLAAVHARRPQAQTQPHPF